MKIFICVLITLSAVLAADNSTVVIQPSSARLYSTDVSSALASSSPILTTIPSAVPSTSHAVAPSTSHAESSKHASSATAPISTSTQVSTSSIMSSIQPSSASTHVPMTSTVPSTTPKPTTTLPPTTTPSPDVTFAVKDKDNKPCLMLKGDMKVMVTYINTTNDIVTYSIPLVRGATVTGKCSDLKYANETASCKLQWKGLLDVSISFIGGDQWYMNDITINVHNKDKVLDMKLDELSAKANYSLKTNDGLYQASFNHSYLCPLDEKLALMSHNETLYNITMDFKDITFQPFPAANGTSISGEMCPAKSDDSSGSSIVPIAVGCALAGLIVIVLIAYLIGRRKGNNRGYQQV